MSKDYRIEFPLRILLGENAGPLLTAMFCISNMLDKTSEEVKDLPADTIEDLEAFSQLEYARGLFDQVHRSGVEAAAKMYVSTILKEFKNNPMLKTFIEKGKNDAGDGLHEERP